MVENNQAKILWVLQIQTCILMISPGIVVVSKHQKTAVVIKVEEELLIIWRVKATLMPPVIGAITIQLGRWLQQIPGATSDIRAEEYNRGNS